ncbi:MAG: hypothetical protein ACOC8H_00850 [bacterium]
MRREVWVRFVVSLCVVLLVGQFGSALGANPQARLGTDERSGPCAPNFGFAYYEKGDPSPGGATDICSTLDSAGNDTLKAKDGVASPENPEPILHFVGQDGDNTVTFVGRTGNCYYIVRGVHRSSGGGGGGSGGGTGGGSAPQWLAEFDSNQETARFVVTLNDRNRSDDDLFVLGERSLIRVELHDEDDATGGSTQFTLSQQPTSLGGTGLVRFVDSGGNEVDPDVPRTVSTDAANEEVYAEGVELGHVTITAQKAAE